MPFGVEGGGNMGWLVNLLKALQGRGVGQGVDSRGVMASLNRGGGLTPEGEVIEPVLPASRWRGAAPVPPAIPGAGAASAGRPNVVSRMLSATSPATMAVPQRQLEATPARSGIAPGGPGPVAAPDTSFVAGEPALQTDAGPSLNEPGIPEPEVEPTGDAELWKSALQNPDILRQAESGQMTSLDLLKALLARRAGAGGPVDIGGPQ